MSWNSNGSISIGSDTTGIHNKPSLGYLSRRKGISNRHEKYKRRVTI